MQKCSKCGVEKELDEFYFKKTRNRYQSYCKKCEQERNKKHNLENPDYAEKHREYSNKFRKSEKGVAYYKGYIQNRQYIYHKYIDKSLPFKMGTINRYGVKLALAVYEKYNNKCSICGSDYRLAIHHIDRNGRNNINKGLPANNDIENLQLLCIRCHGSIHGKQNPGRKKSYVLPRL